MKIISGKLKGRSIPSCKEIRFRPTLSRVREDLFNLINHNKILNIDLNKVVFCDLFCGSGSVGLEALSRGAKKVIFNDIENSNTTLVKNLLIKTELINFEIYNQDAYYENFFIKNCDIVFIDPPYENELKLFEDGIYSQISENCVVIIESNKTYDHQNIILKKEYKNKKLYFLKKII